MLLRKVQCEMQVRQPPKLQPLYELAAYVTRSVIERLDRVGLFLARAADIDVDARMLHIRLHADLADDHRPLQPRIFQLPGQHGVDFVRDLLAHAFMTVIRGWTHSGSPAALVAPHFLNDLEFLSYQKRAEDAIGFVQNLLQQFLNIPLFIGQRYNAHHRPLPQIVMIQLRDSHVNLPSQLILQAAKHLPLVLQRLRVRDVQLEGKQADRHERLQELCWVLSARRRRTGLRSSFRGAEFGHLEAFQNVADLDVVEIGDAHAALKAGAHFAGIVLEALQRAELRSIDHRAFAHDANLRIALEYAVDDVAARNRAGTLDAERVAYCRAAHIGLLAPRFEQAFHSLLNLVGNFVDDGVRPNLDVLLLRELRRFAVRPDAEGNDDRAGGRSQQHVVLGYRAHAGPDDLQLYLVVRKFRQHFGEYFDRALHVALDDDAQFLDLASLQLFVQLIERDAPAAGACHGRVALLRLPELHDMARFGFVGDLEVVSGVRDALQTKHFHRSGWRRVFGRASTVVAQRAHFSKDGTADKEIAELQRAVLNQNRRHRPAAFVHARFQHGAGRRGVWIRFQFAQIRHQPQRFEQLGDSRLLLRRNFHKFGIAAPFRGQQVQIRKLALHALHLCFRFIDLVDGNHDRHIRGSGVIDRFFGLRHDAIIGGHHQH